MNQNTESISNKDHEPNTCHNNKQDLNQLQLQTEKRAVCTSEGAMSPDMPCWKERPAPTQKIIAPEISEDTYLMVV